MTTFEKHLAELLRALPWGKLHRLQCLFPIAAQAEVRRRLAEHSQSGQALIEAAVVRFASASGSVEYISGEREEMKGILRAMRRPQGQQMRKGKTLPSSPAIAKFG
jgi:hypothetical protein